MKHRNLIVALVVTLAVTMMIMGLSVDPNGPNVDAAPLMTGTIVSGGIMSATPPPTDTPIPFPGVTSVPIPTRNLTRTPTPGWVVWLPRVDKQGPSVIGDPWSITVTPTP